ncbi:MAG: ATP-binding protein [Planctomycetota bacterium]|jgi:predicted AAA+ superfamily ATPase
MQEVLIKHNPLWGGHCRDTGVLRELLDRLIPAIDVKHIIAIAGARRSGKSYLFRQLQAHLLESNTPAENILQINFEDPFFIHRKEDPSLLPELYSEYLTLKDPKGRCYLFLDEIQNIKDWQYWVRELYDSEDKVKVFVTGSNAEMLSVEIDTHLTGRALTFENFPFSYRELLHALPNQSLPVLPESSKPDELVAQLYPYKERALHLLEQTFEHSFFPEVCGLPQTELTKEILSQYFSNVIFKDIVPRFSIRNAGVIEELAYYLSTNFTSEFSYHSLAKVVGSNENTVKGYLSYFEKAYLFYTVPHYDHSVKKQLARPKKIYVSDVGLRTATAFQFSPDSGRYVENIIFNSLRRTSRSIFYWKSPTNSEIDFLVQRKGVNTAINVCYSDAIPEREYRGFSALKEAGITATTNTLISKNRFDLVEYEGVTIQIIPIWAYLLT